MQEQKLVYFLTVRPNEDVLQRKMMAYNSEPPPVPPSHPAGTCLPGNMWDICEGRMSVFHRREHSHKATLFSRARKCESSCFFGK